VEIDTGTVQDRGLLQSLLLGTTGSLPSGYGENTYTLGATHSEHSVQEQPQAGNQNDMLPSSSIWYSNQLMHCVMDAHSNRSGLLLITRAELLTKWLQYLVKRLHGFGNATGHGHQRRLLSYFGGKHCLLHL